MEIHRSKVEVRHCERSEAIQNAASEDWIASSQRLLAMTGTGVAAWVCPIRAAQTKRRQLSPPPARIFESNPSPQIQCHRPADRATQYAVTSRRTKETGDYWITR